MKQKGFTLIELVIVTAMIAMIATVSIANFRKGEKSRGVNVAIDGFTGALTSAQNLSLTGRGTNNANAACRDAQYYFVAFDYSTTYRLQALNNCSTVDTIETFRLPANTRIKVTGLVLAGNVAPVSMAISFTLPYGQLRGSIDNGAYNSFTNAFITVESSDGTVTRTLTVNGLSGRISQ